MRRLRLILVLALCGACFRTTAPPGWLPTLDRARTDAYGGWIRVEFQTGAIVEGELLAATRDTIHMLTGTEGWVPAPVSRVKKATLTGYDLSIQPLVAWGVAGTVSTLSHGVVLILTAPTWIIASTTSAASASRAPRVVSTNPSELNLYARFPQGLPPGIDRSAIRGKQAAAR